MQNMETFQKRNKPKQTIFSKHHGVEIVRCEMNGRVWYYIDYDYFEGDIFTDARKAEVTLLNWIENEII